MTDADIAQLETGKKQNPSLDVLKRLARDPRRAGGGDAGVTDPLSREQRDAIAAFVAEMAENLRREMQAQRREYIGFALGLVEAIQKVDDDLRPIALAITSRGLVSADDVDAARTSLAAYLAAHPKAGEFWRAIDELKRLAAELDRDADSSAT